MSTPTDWPGHRALPEAARATYEALVALGFGTDYAYRAAAGAVLGACGSDRGAPEAALRGRAAMAGKADPWADFVVAVMLDR